MIIWWNNTASTFEDTPTSAGQYEEIEVEVADYLGWGRTASNWTTEEVSILSSYINGGATQFYFPPILPGQSKSHEWTFMKPTDTIVAWAAVAVVNTLTTAEATADGGFTTDTNFQDTGAFSGLTSDTATSYAINITDAGTSGATTGYHRITALVDDDNVTIATTVGTGLTATADVDYELRLADTVTATHSNGISTVTASTSTFFETMEGKSLVITDIGTFTITEYVSATVVKVSGNATTATGKTFSISCNGDYLLPKDFGGLDGPLTFAQDEGYVPIEVVPESIIRERRQYNISAQRSYMAAVRPKKDHSGASVQRYELMLFPVPSSDYNLSYRYVVNTRKLSRTNNYPIGCDRPIHYETLLASCLAYAESRRNDERGIKWQEFIEKLTASISHDVAASTPETVGYNGDRSGSYRYRGRRQLAIDLSGSIVTYNGTSYGD